MSRISINDILGGIDWDLIEVALGETLFMTFTSLFFAVIIGFFIGIIIFMTKKNGLWENVVVSWILNSIVNILRAVPFIILLCLLIPFTKALVGTMLGAKAAIPALIFSAAPFYARMTLIALNEVDGGTMEACKALGASNGQIIVKTLLPEALPALVSGVTVTGISLVGYTAMAGAIGSGGLGNIAYLYGWARRNPPVMYLATILVLIIVFIIQSIGDLAVKKIDKR